MRSSKSDDWREASSYGDPYSSLNVLIWRMPHQSTSSRVYNDMTGPMDDVRPRIQSSLEAPSSLSKRINLPSTVEFHSANWVEVGSADNTADGDGAKMPEIFASDDRY